MNPNNNVQNGMSFRVVLGGNGGPTMQDGNGNEIPDMNLLLSQFFMNMGGNFGGGMGGMGGGESPIQFGPNMFMNLPFGMQQQGGNSLQDFLNRTFLQYQQQHAGPPPASQSIVESMNERDLTEEEITKQEECPVCQDKFKDAEAGNVSQGVQLPCSHIYHKACIIEWIKQHNTCPVCRAELPTDDPDYEKSKGRPPPANPQTRTFNPPPTIGGQPSATGSIPSRTSNNDNYYQEDEMLRNAIRMSLEEHEREERQKLRQDQDQEYLQALAQDQVRDQTSNQNNYDNNNNNQGTKWECSVCTFHNPLVNNACEMCGHTKQINTKLVINDDSMDVDSTKTDTTTTPAPQISEEKKPEIKQTKRSEEEHKNNSLSIQELRSKRLAALDKKSKVNPNIDSDNNTENENNSGGEEQEEEEVKRRPEKKQRVNLEEKEEKDNNNNNNNNEEEEEKTLGGEAGGWWGKLKGTIWGDEDQK